MTQRPAAALVRDISPRLDEALLTFQQRTRIDVDRARAQHAAYVTLLEGLGVEIVRAPAAPDHPDASFVEDTVVVVDDLAIGTRPGAPSRRDEPATVLPVLAARGYRVERIAPPARLDGGDVLQVDDTLFVGTGSRTDATATTQLAAIVRPSGREVVAVAVNGALHLKTAITALPDGSLLGCPDHLDVAAFGDRPFVRAVEPTGANVLVVGDTVVASASAPRTIAMLVARGLRLQVLAIDEFEKAEAGLTCLSVLLPR